MSGAGARGGTAEARRAAKALGVIRIIAGAAFVLSPRRAAAGWVGADGEREGATVLARGLGVRDVLLGAMVLHTADHPDAGPRWVAATAACDAADLAATAAVWEHLPKSRAALAVLVAGGGALTGFDLARKLRSGD